jgi:hypothetical protein
MSGYMVVTLTRVMRGTGPGGGVLAVLHMVHGARVEATELREPLRIGELKGNNNMRPHEFIPTKGCAQDSLVIVEADS